MSMVFSYGLRFSVELSWFSFGFRKVVLFERSLMFSIRLAFKEGLNFFVMSVNAVC